MPSVAFRRHRSKPSPKSRNIKEQNTFGPNDPAEKVESPNVSALQRAVNGGSASLVVV
jgi:hypothetical protein